MKNIVNIKEMSREELEKSYMALHTKVEQLSQENNWYREQVKLQQKKLFGQSSEKVHVDQLSLFDEIEFESTPINDESNITEVKSHKRKKKSKLMDLDSLKNTSIDYVLSADERMCPKCNHELHEMSQKVRKELVFVPSKVEVVNHIEHVYSCRNCEKNDIEATIIKADGPTPLISGSIASSSLVSNIINDKYAKSLPLYRQEVSFQRMGININRQNMSNWLVRVANSYFKPMISYMYKQLMQAQYINADETSVQVLREPGKKAASKSYIWVYMTGRSEDKQYVLFNYEPSRSHKHAIDYLEDFKGVLTSDGYQAYDEVEDVIQTGCWAHARRKFKEALDLVPKSANPETTQTYQCFSMINELFAIEREYKECDYDELTKIRQKKSKPIVKKFFKKIHELHSVSLPKSRFGEAINYAYNQESKLKTYLVDGKIEISNNAAENIIRPFTIGRKNWLFMNTVKGANSSCYIYSLVESAKMNNLKPYDYFQYILDRLPDLDLTDEKALETVMPWAKLPEELYVAKKS